MKAIAITAVGLALVAGVVFAQNSDRYIGAIASIDNVVDGYRTREAQLQSEINDAEGERDAAQSNLDAAQAALETAQGDFDDAVAAVDAAQAALDLHQSTEGQATIERALAIAREALMPPAEEMTPTPTS